MESISFSSSVNMLISPPAVAEMSGEVGGATRHSGAWHLQPKDRSFSAVQLSSDCGTNGVVSGRDFDSCPA